MGLCVVVLAGCGEMAQSGSAALGEPCVKNVDCQGGLTCDNGYPGGNCTSLCMVDGDCGMNARCSGGKCFPQCMSANDCKRGAPWDCMNGVCTAPPLVDASVPDLARPDLATPDLAAADLAAPGCGKNPDCPAGEKCVPDKVMGAICVCDPNTCTGCCDGAPHCLPPASSQCGSNGSTCKTCSFNGVNGCFIPDNKCQSECAGCWTGVMRLGGGLNGVLSGMCVPGNQDTACGLPWGQGNPPYGLCVACKNGEHCVNGQCMASPDMAMTPVDLASRPDLNACANGVLDGKESDVDCGGPDCPGCGGGRICAVNGDCVTMLCASFRCAAPASCANGMLDGMETDIDCGGLLCNRCRPGLKCKVGGDCRSGQCANGLCTAPAGCSNGLRDGNETDVDCGGPDCAPCANRKACAQDFDCASAACVKSTCVAVTCRDGKKDGAETDVDCGGPDCLPCVNGLACAVDNDCVYRGCRMNVCSGCGKNPDCPAGEKCIPDKIMGTICVCDPNTCTGCCDTTPHCVMANSSQCGSNGSNCKFCSFNGVNGCFIPDNKCQSDCPGCWTNVVFGGGGNGTLMGKCVPGNQDTACGLPWGQGMPPSYAMCVACTNGQHCVMGKCM